MTKRQGVDVREIAYQSGEYRQSLDLRDDILRKPIGLCLFDEDLSAEADDVHIAAMSGETLVGILVLTRVSETCVQMRQVAVRESDRGNGIGQAMVAFSEETARKAGYSEMMLHARKAAVDFYLKLGYAVRGGEFTEVGIPHFEMHKAL